MAKYDLTNAKPFNEQPLYKQGFEDAIDKACVWLKANINQYIGAVVAHNIIADVDVNVYPSISTELFGAFKKAMEEAMDTPFRDLELFYVAVLSPEGQLLDVFYYRDSDEMLAKCREVEAQGYTADKGVI